MNSTRVWIALLALVCFLAGGAAGLLSADVLLARDRQPVPFASYQDHLESRFELGPARRRGLRMVMSSYHRALEDAKARRAAAMEDELVQLGLTYRALIRNHVLPESRRAEFDRMSAAGLPLAAAP